VTLPDWLDHLRGDNDQEFNSWAWSLWLVYGVKLLLCSETRQIVHCHVPLEWKNLGPMFTLPASFLPREEQAFLPTTTSNATSRDPHLSSAEAFPLENLSGVFSARGGRRTFR
jgi:hypothetical protein